MAQDRPEKSVVKTLLKKIENSKQKFDKDFKRMRRNIEFATGIQWEGQKDVEEERYIANLTLQMIRNKVAYLYARNPEVEITRRERMDFMLWDGQIDSLAQAYQGVMSGRMVGLPDLESEALMADFMHGRAEQQRVDKICEALQFVHSWQVDQSRPEFKEMMKQLVTRVVTCGVGFCRIHFVRGGDNPISTVETQSSTVDRTKLTKVLLDKIQENGLDEDSPEVEDLRSLVLSLGATPSDTELEEKIEFDFPLATNIIIDERCRALKEFVAARWIAQEYNITLDEVNQVFGTEIKNQDLEGNREIVKPNLEEDCKDEELHRVFEVLDYTKKTRCFIMEGYCDYLKSPEPLAPQVAGFWPIFALTFNDVEVDPQTKASIYPPSDVDLIRHPQMEWNRTREALRNQRNANAPTYLTRKGLLTESDKQSIRDRQPNEIVELEGLPASMKPDEAVGILQVAAIDQAVYATTPLEQDMQLGAGVQQANIGPAQPNVTATVGSIAEQSRMTVSSSNVDDLDGFLTRLAKACIEMELREFTPMTVKRIAGSGAPWPMEDREQYLNMINIQVKAASSGRPNKAIEVSNFSQIAPQLISAGANPIAIIEEGVRRLDDRLDVTKFFPVAGSVPPGGGPQVQPHPVSSESGMPQAPMQRQVA